MKTNNKNIFRKIITVALIIFAMASCKKCEYIQCSDQCDMIESFDGNDSIIKNWEGQVHLKEIVDSINHVLHLGYGLPGEVVSNTKDFPTNLAGAGCKLKYDVAYKTIAGGGVTVNPTNGLIIFSGTAGSMTDFAEFVLYTSSAIIDGDPMRTIEVPLELANGTVLPSNAFGKWVINGITAPTAADITTFNSLIQNISGIALDLDAKAGLEGEWFFDNFCVTDCCTETIHID